ncbi:MAG: hypothetical protein R3301_12715 [Saprospiraceae bacterium]|nr:hypothetical protein [Saprospiraceae bacterium]
MKTLKKSVPALMLALFVTTALSAQMMFAIHEDRVYPSAVTKYEKAAANLVANLKKYNVPNADYLALMTSDFQYIYVAPIPNMAALDDNPFAMLDEKMGQEEVAKMWSGFSDCYDEHGDYILTLDEDLSYQPSGINQNPEGEYYRTLDYWYVSEDNEEALRAVASKIKQLHADTGSKFYYRVYRSGFGAMGPFYMVASAAKDAQDWHNRLAAVEKAGGEKRQALLQEALSLTRKYERRTGWIRPDLSYMSGN